MLTLDLVRHGEAEPSHAGGDLARPLTERGATAIRDLGAELRDRPPRPVRCFASPLARARQTAALLVAACEGGAGPAGVEALPELRPDGNPEDVLEALRALGADEGHVMLVGHMPLLGLLFARLTGRSEGFPPGSLKRIECPNGLGPRSGTCTLTLPAST